MTALERITALYLNASERPEFSASLDWYRTAREWIEGMALRLDRPVEQIAAVVAALSPQVPWSYQRGATEKWIRDTLARRPARYAGFRASKLKARRILAGEAPDIVLGGPKVRAFFAAFMGCPDAPVMDRHAAAAAGCADWRINRPRRYYQLAEVYLALARFVGREVREVQAVVWVEWRRVNGVTI